MNHAQQELKQLTVSNELLDQLLSSAVTHGALGAKLTGGGRGGCFIVLLENKEKAEQIQQLLKDQVTDTWIQGLGVYENETSNG